MRSLGSRGHHGGRLAIAAIALLVLLALGPGEARSAKRGQVTLTALAYVTNQPSFSAMIQNFERRNPSITIDVTYAPTVATLYQLETTELAAGNAPDILQTYPGCGTPISMCKL